MIALARLGTYPTFKEHKIRISSKSLRLVAVLHGYDSQGRGSSSPTLDYLCCDAMALTCSDVLDRRGDSSPQTLVRDRLNWPCAQCN